MKSINRDVPSLIWTHIKDKQVHSKREKDKFIGVEEAEVIFSFSFLSLSDIVLSDESIQKKLLGFLPCGFPGKIYFSLLCYACLSFNDPIALD